MGIGKDPDRLLCRKPTEMRAFHPLLCRSEAMREGLCTECLCRGCDFFVVEARLVDIIPERARMSDDIAIANDILLAVDTEPQQRFTVLLMLPGARHVGKRTGHGLLVVLEQQDEVQFARFLLRADARRLAFSLRRGLGLHWFRRLGLTGRRRLRLRRRLDRLDLATPTSRQLHRHHRGNSEPDDGDCQDARTSRSRRLILKHGDPPLEIRKRPGGAGGRQTGSRPGDAERQEKPAIVLRRDVQRVHHRRIARRLPRQRVFARGKPDEGMKEEQPLGECRNAAEPEIRALDVRQLVADRHLLLTVGQRFETSRWEQHDGS